MLIGQTSIANKFGAFPVASVYDTPITISESNFRGVLFTFTGPQLPFEGDSDLVNFNVDGDGDTPQVMIMGRVVSLASWILFILEAEKTFQALTKPLQLVTLTGSHRLSEIKYNSCNQ